jgi:hypothetical protein
MKKSPEKLFVAAAMGFIAIICIVVLNLLCAWFGECVPGSWFERSRYTAEIYVNLFPAGSESKNYRVPALIDAFFDDQSDYEGGTVWYRVYRLRHVTFPNGGQVKFEENNDETLQLGKRVYIEDDEHRPWHIELTRERPPARK